MAALVYKVGVSLIQVGRTATDSRPTITMTLDKPLNEKSDKSDARLGGETPPERFLDRYVGNAIHLFFIIPCHSDHDRLRR